MAIADLRVAATAAMGSGLAIWFGSGSLLAIGLGGGALAQTVCPAQAQVDGQACTVAPGTTITVTSQATPGLKASNPGGVITADGVALVLGPGGATGQRAYVGGAALTGGGIIFDGGILRSGQAATGQRGLFADGAGSTIAARDAILTLGLGATVASDNIAVLASGGGTANLVNTQVTTLGGGNGLANHALQAVGTGSRITFRDGIASTLGRASYGASAEGGGVIVVDGSNLSTTGADVRATFTGSYALYATGAGSRIEGAGATASASGAYANAARAENGGTIALTGAHLSTTGAGSELNPAAAARATAGGVLTLTGAGTSLTGASTFGHGLAVDGAGSTATVSDATITVSGSRATGVYVGVGGLATIGNSTVSSGAFPAIDVAGGALTLTNVAARATAASAAALRSRLGGDVTMTGGSLTTEGRDGIGLAQSLGTSRLNGVTVTTTGDDNAMGLIADLDGRIEVTGGSVTTTGNGGVRDSSTYPHALTARNTGGVLVANGVALRTTGRRAFGAVADDGGSAALSNLVIRTEGDSGLGLFAVTEQSGALFPAALAGDHLTIETIGRLAYGATAQARNDLDVETASLVLSDSMVTTQGEGAQGLRAVLADYGTGPKADRGEARLTATRVQVSTVGVGAHGALARDNPASVTLDAATILTRGAYAHGAVAQAGGRIVGVNGTAVSASGVDAAALFVISEAAPISTASFTGGSLRNVSGPTIAMAGLATVTLTNVTVDGGGQWLKAAATTDFLPLAGDGPRLTGPGDTPDQTPPGDPPADEPEEILAPAAAAGLATLSASGSTLNGSAFTASGSISNVTFTNGTVWTMTGSSNLTSLINDASAVRFATPTGDIQALPSYLTLTVVNYQGAAGELHFNTFLGDESSPSDRLVLDGGVGGGTSLLHVANSGGLGAVTRGSGILVVDAINGATTTGDMLALAGPVVAGPYEYRLFRGDVPGLAPSSWYLRSAVDCSASGAPSPPCPSPPAPPPPPPPTPPTPPTPTPPTPDEVAFVRAEVSLYAALPAIASLYGRTIIDTLHERVGEEEHLRGVQQPEDDENFNGVWGRVMLSNGRREGSADGVYGNRGPRFNYDFSAFQAGVDLYRLEHDDGVRDHAGLYGAFGRARGKVRNWDGGTAGKDIVDAWSLGAYWTRFDGERAYLDGVVQYTWYDVEAQSTRLPTTKGHARGFAASLEGGKPYDLKHDWKIEPQGQLIYQHFFKGSTQDAGGRVRLDETDSLVGRIGARLHRTWVDENDDGEERLRSGWGRLNLWHEFLDQPRVTFATQENDVSFRSDTGRNWLELNGGATLQMSQRGFFYLNASYTWDLDGRGHSYGGKLGLRFNW